ncbi:MAG: hypothetical protein OES26_16845 [Gammaproteobacteria bacterium]|nr:hypothetical protein [Gammaproteobacteria bacterium]
MPNLRVPASKAGRYLPLDQCVGNAVDHCHIGVAAPHHREAHCVATTTLV